MYQAGRSRRLPSPVLAPAPSLCLLQLLKFSRRGACKTWVKGQAGQDTVLILANLGVKSGLPVLCNWRCFPQIHQELNLKLGDSFFLSGGNYQKYLSCLLYPFSKNSDEWLLFRQRMCLVDLSLADVSVDDLASPWSWGFHMLEFSPRRCFRSKKVHRLNEVTLWSAMCLFISPELSEGVTLLWPYREYM